eukprot:11778313-Ditylum_brightwellii.AAC.1
MNKQTKLEKKITAGELQCCLMKHHQLEGHLQKAENNIGIYMCKKKMNHLYLGKNQRNDVFLWCCYNGDVPKNNDIDENLFKPRRLMRQGEDGSSDEEETMPPLVKSNINDINPWQSG